MRIGVVGIGFMGSTHAASWAEVGAEIAGFAASTAERARSLADKYGATAYPSLEAMLADVDVVDICAPTHLHRDMTLQAAAAGKHVICEKPLALNVAQGQEMIRACQEAGVRLFVAHVVRFFPEYAAIKATIDQGQIGPPAVVRLFRRSFQSKKAAGTWFLDLSKSGGILLDLMVHDIDYARWIAGDIKRVYAKNLAGRWPQAGVNHALVILTHTSGAISHVEASWAYPPPIFWTGVEVAGADGLIQYDSRSGAAVEPYLHQASGPVSDVALPAASPLLENPYTTQIKAFYNALCYDTPVPVSPLDGLAAVQAATAAIESARTGQAIELEPLPEVQA